jgi:hypothetical protein
VLIKEVKEDGGGGCSKERAKLDSDYWGWMIDLSFKCSTLFENRDQTWGH